MLFQHIGHAEFLIETESGVRIVTDPYDAGCGYPLQRLKADVALISHHHHDHDAVENLKGEPRIIDTEGKFSPEPDVKITAIRGFHDNAGGSRRGETLLFLIETEGLRIVHLGDLGCMLNQEQLETLKNPDVLMIPTGGFYTIDGKTARAVAEALQPAVTLPMHYKTSYNADWPISGPEAFLEGIPEEDIRRDIEALRITAGDIRCQPRAALFKA
jgi:L-ascorbate metabolism protein UlaG (beta-lactamase superfamily)